MQTKPKAIRNANSSINGCIKTQTKLIFKKKNLKNFFYKKNNESKNKINCLSTEISDLEINQKRKINEQLKTENSGSPRSINDDSISLNTLRTYSTNKSMKHFYQRNPRKLKKSKRKKQKSEEKLSLKKLKKEKNEILKSLKILMKKKNELDEEDKKEKVKFEN